jgi:hypothetical protein
MSTPLRRIFQLDGIGGGVLSIAERPHENRVLLVVSTEKGEAQIGLSQEDFTGLADLQHTLRFGEAEPRDDAAALKAVA